MSRDWPTNKRESDHMVMRQQQNRARNIMAEVWFGAYLDRTGYTWTRQARWGYRLFDFWCHKLGIAVEVDGPSHSTSVDAASDLKMLERSGILVFRVNNYDTVKAEQVIATICDAETWNERRARLRMKAITT